MTKFVKKFLIGTFFYYNPSCLLKPLITLQTLKFLFWGGLFRPTGTWIRIRNPNPDPDPMTQPNLDKKSFEYTNNMIDKIPQRN
jgi:hypothetical protein